MAESIVKRIENKQIKIKGLWESIRLYMDRKVTLAKRQKVEALQNKLSFRLLELEEQGLDFKIKIYNELLKELK